MGALVAVLALRLHYSARPMAVKTHGKVAYGTNVVMWSTRRVATQLVGESRSIIRGAITQNSRGTHIVSQKVWRIVYELVV
jgi:hypothetical protein